MNRLTQRLQQARVIAAVRGPDELTCALASPVQVIFLLGGDLFSLPELVERVQRKNKLVFVHLDLIEGISRDAAGVKWIAQKIKPDGVLSTRASLLKISADEGLMTILRMFMVDGSSMATGERMVKSCSPNLVELMPGLVTRAIKMLGQQIAPPIIAGGMLELPRDVHAALEAGAVAASTSSEALWGLNI